MQLSSLGEFGLIDSLARSLTLRSGTLVGVGDDAAVLAALKAPIVTADALVEGIHFRRDWSRPRALGRKAMAVNLSDLASCGAAPIAAFVCLALSSGEEADWVAELYAGFEDCAAEYGFTVAGGDTTRSNGGVTLAVTLIGEPMQPARGPVLRSGALPGDVLLVTGSLGDAAAGLELLKRGCSPDAWPWSAGLIHSQLEPVPRLREVAAALARYPVAIHAALDISDGLSGDASHLARQSSVSVNIQTAGLPISENCRAAAGWTGSDALNWALAGGEDYELLLAVDPNLAEAVATAITVATGTVVTIIGECTNGEPAVTLTRDGRSIPVPAGYTHF